MKSSSYIAMPSEKAAKLAQACIDRILVAREKERNEIVKTVRDQLNEPSWWDKLLGKTIKQYTEDEVRNILEMRTSLHSEFYRVGIKYGAQLNTAYCILNASKHSDMVNISVTDLDKIS